MPRKKVTKKVMQEVLSAFESYREKCCTAEQAVQVIQSNQTVYVHSGCGHPERLTKAMAKRAPELRNVKVVHLMTAGSADYAKPGLEQSFRHVGLFIGGNVRQAVKEGRADYVPIFLGEIEELVSSGAMPIDVALIQVSPPNQHGFCTLGVGIDTTKTVCEHAKVIIAQVNPKMPRTRGYVYIHMSEFDFIVESDDKILELPMGGLSETSHRIGRNIAGLIEDGSTLQLGIGEIPDAVLAYLKSKKDLGIHTEMVSDSAVELFDKGIINNEKKTVHPGKAILGFVLGTKRLYDFIDDNPMFEFHPTKYTNDPFVIAKNDKMVAINSAIEVDLTGQVCADSVGYNIYSGFGGQVDFMRGAARSKGGKPVIALPATARNDTVSRIVPHLKEGAGVVTSRADVHYVVTEFGVAYLHGKSVGQRARALIDIAHPNFREELTKFAIERHWL
jgi:4-hydroxybutyrate CoA-transferase